jgi:hypothetical protein
MRQNFPIVPPTSGKWDGALQRNQLLENYLDKWNRRPKRKTGWEGSVRVKGAVRHLGCQIILGTAYQNWEKYTKRNEIYQMTIQYIKWLKIFLLAINYTNGIHSKALHNKPEWDFFGMKYDIWQSCSLRKWTVWHDISYYVLFFSSDCTNMEIPIIDTM